MTVLDDRYRREVPLSDSRLRRLVSDVPDPEALMIEREDPPAESPERPTLPEELLTAIREFLPPEEAYLLEAYYLNGQRQAAIASHIGCVNSAVQYRLARALERARWAMSLRTWRRPSEEVRQDLEPLDQHHREFAVVLWRHRWNQSRTAQHIGGTQSTARLQTVSLYNALVASSSDERVEPYMSDLSNVMERHAWNMGGFQSQGQRTIRILRTGRRRRRAA